jgi:hypothetical protein
MSPAILLTWNPAKLPVSLVARYADGAASRAARENLRYHGFDAATDGRELQPLDHFPLNRPVLVSRHKRWGPPRLCDKRRRNALSP